MNNYIRLNNEQLPRKHNGIFRKNISLWEATALLVPIGAGVLGIPYAVAQVGLFIGILYIIILGGIMMALNLLVGEIMVRTKGKKQLVGLAKRYLGTTGQVFMSVIIYLGLFGTLVVYIIGIGESLATIFSGGAFFWSTVFFLLGSIVIFIGLRTIKKIEFLLILGVLVIVGVIAIFSTPYVALPHITYTNWGALLFPYGVILFAFHGTTSIPEAHSLLIHKSHILKKAFIYAMLIAMCIYAVFAVIVVGVTGTQTTGIATIGLGLAIGPSMLLFGNLFAVLAMGSSFLMVGVALRDSFVWDIKIPQTLASFLVCGIPFLIFLLGLRQFITAVDIVGGLFGSMEFVLLLLIYYQAKRKGDLPVGKYKLHHTAIVAILLFAMFAVGTVMSLMKLF